MYKETVWDFESKGSIGKVCVLHHAVHNLQFYSPGNQTGFESQTSLYVLGTGLFPRGRVGGS
jgi:hypothetical protein